MVREPALDQEASGPRSTKYRADIDGLRGIAVLAVVVFHAWPSLLPGGFVGVDVFFVISGFLITGILLGSLSRDRFSAADFYARRIRRLFPALFVVLAASFVCGWFLLGADAYKQFSLHMAAGVGFVANFVFWDEAGYFDNAAETKPLWHLWSLGIEEQFYLAWPVLLVVAWRLRLKPLWLTAGLLSVSLLYSVYTVRTDLVGAFYSPLTRFWELLVGAILACVAAERRGAWLWLSAIKGRRAPGVLVLREAASAAGLFLIVLACVLLNEDRLFPGLWALLPTGGALLLIAAGPASRINRTLLSHRALVWVGLISYPLYLWHWPLLSFARIAAGETPSPAIRLVVVLASIGLAHLTYRMVEVPVRHGPSRRLMVPALCTSMLVALTAAVLTYRAEGLIDRPITRSDRAQFLQYYDRMHKHGLSDAYRQECDFMDWSTGAVRESIDASCTQPGSARTIFLWGDSYAQALSAGLRAAAPAGTRIAQVTTSLCRPALDDMDPQVPDGRCRRSNEFALDRIRALSPAIVVLAQKSNHVATDWSAVAATLRSLQVERVVLVGPAPSWSPSLPEVVAAHYWDSRYDRVSRGLSSDIFEADRALKARTAGVPGLTYVSLLDELCSTEGCQAVVEGSIDLIALDSGHFTPRGSVYVVDQVLRPHLFARP